MTFSSQPKGSRVKSDNTHTHSHHMTFAYTWHLRTQMSCPYTWHLRLDFQQLRPFCSLSQPHHATASHPSPGDNHQSTGGRSERTQGKQKWPRKTQSVTYVPRLSTVSDLPRIVAQPLPSFLCCPRLPSHHPFSLTSASLVSALHLLPPSTPFSPYGTHYHQKRLAMQGREREIDTLSVRRPQPHTTNL